MESKSLGKRLRDLRSKSGLTMRQTHELTGITQGYISQIENDIYVPSARTLALLARAYSVEELELLRIAGVLALERPNGSLELAASGLTLVTPGRLVPLLQHNGKPIVNACGTAAGLHLPASFFNGDDGCFILECGDNAMQPLVGRGDWVLVSPALRPRHGEVAVLLRAQRYTLRRCLRKDGVVAFEPLQTRFASWSLTTGKADQVKLVGRALRLVARELPRGPDSSA